MNISYKLQAAYVLLLNRKSLPSEVTHLTVRAQENVLFFEEELQAKKNKFLSDHDELFLLQCIMPQDFPNAVCHHHPLRNC